MLIHVGLGQLAEKLKLVAVAAEILLGLGLVEILTTVQNTNQLLLAATIQKY